MFWTLFFTAAVVTSEATEVRVLEAISQYDGTGVEAMCIANSAPAGQMSGVLNE